MAGDGVGDDGMGSDGVIVALMDARRIDVTMGGTGRGAMSCCATSRISAG